MEVGLIEENEDFKALLSRCMHKDYSQRPSAAEIFKDPFFAGFTND